MSNSFGKEEFIYKSYGDFLNIPTWHMGSFDNKSSKNNLKKSSKMYQTINIDNSLDFNFDNKFLNTSSNLINSNSNTLVSNTLPSKNTTVVNTLPSKNTSVSNTLPKNILTKTLPSKNTSVVNTLPKNTSVVNTLPSKNTSVVNTLPKNTSVTNTTVTNTTVTKTLPKNTVTNTLPSKNTSVTNTLAPNTPPKNTLHKNTMDNTLTSKNTSVSSKIQNKPSFIKFSNTLKNETDKIYECFTKCDKKNLLSSFNDKPPNKLNTPITPKFSGVFICSDSSEKDKFSKTLEECNVAMLEIENILSSEVADSLKSAIDNIYKVVDSCTAILEYRKLAPKYIPDIIMYKNIMVKLVKTYKNTKKTLPSGSRNNCTTYPESDGMDIFMNNCTYNDVVECFPVIINEENIIKYIMNVITFDKDVKNESLEFILAIVSNIIFTKFKILRDDKEDYTPFYIRMKDKDIYE